MESSDSGRSHIYHLGRIAFQIILGAILAYLSFLFWVRLLRGATAIAVLSGYSVIFVVPSLVVYAIGRFGRQRGSYVSTLIGGIVGLFSYMTIISVMGMLGLSPN